MQFGNAEQATNQAPVNEDCAKAYAPSGLRGGTATSHTNGLRGQLWTRQRKLERDLKEVQEALSILDNDETVNKLLKVFEIAGK